MGSWNFCSGDGSVPATVEAKSGFGDTIRAILGFLATVVVLALLYQPPISSWGLLAICVAIVAICVVTAHDRRVVVYGILAILVSRVIMGLALALLRHYRVPYH
jgi:hypothetical protein